MLSLLALNLAGVDGLPVMVAVLFIGFGFLGLVVPPSSVLALDEHGEIAGAASALMGILQLVLGAVVIPLTSVSNDGSARPMVAGSRRVGMRLGVCSPDARRGCDAPLRRPPCANRRALT